MFFWDSTEIMSNKNKTIGQCLDIIFIKAAVKAIKMTSKRTASVCVRLALSDEVIWQTAAAHQER